jgi:hypothetical protein
MADVLKYGWVRGGRQGSEMKLAKSNSYNRLGGAFVCASGDTGVMKIAVAEGTDAVVGWAEVPRAAVPGVVDYWTSSSTIGKDKVFIVTDPTAVFRSPVYEDTASLTASMVGQMANIIISGSGTTLKQMVDANATAATPAEAQFFVMGVDLVARSVDVRLNPHGLA